MPLDGLIAAEGDGGPSDGNQADGSLDPGDVDAADEIERQDAATDAGLGALDAAPAPPDIDGNLIDVSIPRDAALLDAAYPDAQLTDAAVVLPAPWEGTLIKQLGTSAADFVAEQHALSLVSAEGPEAPPPFVFATTNQVGGFSVQPPDRRDYWLHVAGNGSAGAPESTNDSLTLWAPRSGDTLARIGNVGTAGVFETTAGFSASADRVAIQGTVYRVDPTGKRTGTIGCAKIYLDNLASPALDVAQRYVSGTLPAPLHSLERTERSGRWFFGNVAPGLHTFRVSVDDGQTFLATKTVYVPFARKDARGDAKAMMVFMGIDVPGADPTPANCPADP
jgi:hypothetical protein